MISKSGISDPVWLPPDASGVGAERLTNSKNLSLALAEILDDAYVDPGTARPGSTYANEFSSLNSCWRRLDDNEQVEFKEPSRNPCQRLVRTAQPCCLCTRHSTYT